MRERERERERESEEITAMEEYESKATSRGRRGGESNDTCIMRGRILA